MSGERRARDQAADERVPFRVRPMLATLVEAPFHKDGWIYEEKYDGYRILAYKEGAHVTLLSRNAKDRTASFADVAAAIGRLRARTLLLDGEVVAFDDRLVSRFQLLQRGQAPRLFAVFDCLYADGRDFRRRPLTARRRALEAAIDGSDRLFPARRLATGGLAAHRVARRHGFEGLIAKDASAPYVEGRSPAWCKVKIARQEEFVIGGCTAPRGTRPRFGALLLGAYHGRVLRYVGKVGTGFTLATLESLWRRLQPLVRERAPFVDPPRERGVRWLAPVLVAQIAFSEWTDDGRLRQPVFLGLRDDKRPRECRLP